MLEDSALPDIFNFLLLALREKVHRIEYEHTMKIKLKPDKNLILYFGRLKKIMGHHFI